MSILTNEHGALCAVAGHPDAARLVYLGLHALQHRGHDHCGIASETGARPVVRRHFGFVSQAFNRADLDALSGAAAFGVIGFCGEERPAVEGLQPRMGRLQDGTFLTAGLIGRVENAAALRETQRAVLVEDDSEAGLLLRLVAAAVASGRDLATAFQAALAAMQGSFSAVLMGAGQLLAAHDAVGVRPLCLAEIEMAGEAPAWLLATEPTPFQLLPVTNTREVAPGELLVMRAAGGELDLRRFAPGAQQHCSMEHVSLARADSRIFALPVQSVRETLGRQLATESPAPADLVAGVPDSGTLAAIGYAAESGVPYRPALLRNALHPVPLASPVLEDMPVRLKYSIVDSLVAGQRIVLVDDTLLRGAVLRRLVSMLRRAGAASVHVRIASPPIVRECPFGVPIPAAEHLLLSTHEADAIAPILGVDSIAFLSHDAFRAALRDPAGQPAFCYQCQRR